MSRDIPNAPSSGTPTAEVVVDDDLLRGLLLAQHPDLAGLAIEPVDAGWDNAMFRLGDRLAVRLPRRALAAALIEHEQAWLPALQNRLPLAIPAPVRTGRPGRGFPWSWSVLPWLEGRPADLEPLAPGQAAPLAGFLRALHADAPPDAPVNPYRGVPLEQRREVVADRLRRLAAATPLITGPVVAAWDAALAAPAEARRCWIHGDLHARNVLVSGGVLTAVIDWGDVCAGDRATDLAAVWTLLDDREAREQAIRAYGEASEATWLRALGWAVSFGTVLLETGLADHPRHAAMGEDILRRISEGPNASDRSLRGFSRRSPDR